MKRLTRILAVVVFAACADEGPLTTAPPDPPATETFQAIELTPFQQSIQNRYAERAEQGLPVPEVSFSYAWDNGASLEDMESYRGLPGEEVTLLATTTIRFDGPLQAGFDRWPSNEIAGEIAPEEGFVREGNYDDEIRDYIADRIPGFWQRHEFGYEPRTRRVTETVTLTYGAGGLPLGRATVDGELVHGFTFAGPDIDQTIGDKSCVGDEDGIEFCAWEFRAGFAMDWGFGLRLPMNVSVTAADAVDEGDVFTPTSMADGADWSAAEYTTAGISPQSGNEYTMHAEFFLGAIAKIAETTVLDIGPPKIDEDESSSFKTPFGPGKTFSLPGIDIPIYQQSVAKVSVEFGASLTPKAGSDKFKANWAASDGLAGNGALTWTDPTQSVDLSSVFAVDGPDLGNLQIKDTKYVFTEYKIGLGAYFEIDFFTIHTERYDIPITDFNVSKVFPDIAVPIHAGASPTTMNAEVTVNNVAPSAAIALPVVQDINGVPVHFADLGAPVAFQATSYDPGLDDLTAVWSWGDETADASTEYPMPVAATTGPNDITDNQQHTYLQACAHPVVFTSTDSDGDSNQDGILAIVRSTANGASRLSGYWQQQYGGTGNVEFSAAELGCLLGIVNAVSTVFDEERDLSTSAAADAVLSLNGNQGSETDKLDRVLLTAWLNFANGVFDLDDLVDSDLDGVPDIAFGTALVTAEAVRRDGLSTQEELQMMREMVHNISAQATE